MPTPTGARTLARRLRGYVEALVGVTLATGLSWLMFPFFDRANLIMTFLIVIVVLAVRHGHGAPVFASIVSVASFDFFFVPPYFTLAVADNEYLLTFSVMLVVGLVISGLTARVRSQTQAARARERRTAALYALSRELAQTERLDPLIEIASRHIAAEFSAQVAVWLPDAGGTLRRRTTEDGADDAKLARQAFEQRQAIGLGTETSASARAAYLPLLGQRGPLGVVSVRPATRGELSGEGLRQLGTFVNQTALALERARFAGEAQEARVRAETERLRSALLASVSHDLRTPLTAITGAVTAMLEARGGLDRRVEEELLESVRDEAERLNRLVQNLLNMTRLESGGLELHRDWHPLEEIVGSSLGRAAKLLGRRPVKVDVPADLPLVSVDDVLVGQVFLNLFENIGKYTPADAEVRIVAREVENKVTVEVADRGPGLPPGEERRVFDKFYRATSNPVHGAGLGLAICRGIVETHGGRMWAHNVPEGGVAFFFTLPAGKPPPVPGDA